MKFTKTLLCVVTLCISIPALAQMDGARGTADVTIKGKKITIDYGRPSLRGRDMLGKATTGMVWRLGMNQATTIETTGDLVIAGKELKAGKYSLWAKKTGDNSWALEFHPKTGIWGDPVMTEGFVAELPLKMEQASDSAEQLTISLTDNKGDAGIKIQWGTALLTGSFKVK
ncbi:MAG TPA: DUF2911 domain-containing protein [Blastocatellia bacterium]|nr:DUF2911 domain-containing protein [Blastocatellia bacterium]